MESTNIPGKKTGSKRNIPYIYGSVKRERYKVRVAKMKKLMIYLVVLTLMVSFVSAATVSRDMPSTIEPGSELTVSFNVAEMEVGKSVAISDTIPSQFTFYFISYIIFICSCN